MIFKNNKPNPIPIDKTFTLKEGFEIQNKKLKIMLVIFIFGSILERTAVALSPTFLYIKSGETISKSLPVEDFCEQVIIAFKEKHFNSIVIDPKITQSLSSALTENPVDFSKIESLVANKQESFCKIVVRDEYGLRGFVLSYEKDERKANPFLYKLTDASEELITAYNKGQ